MTCSTAFFLDTKSTAGGGVMICNSSIAVVFVIKDTAADEERPEVAFGNFGPSDEMMETLRAGGTMAP